MKKTKKKPVVPTCRSCLKPLERAERSEHRVWYVCTNMFCEKNKKRTHSIIAKAAKEDILQALDAMRKKPQKMNFACPTGYTWMTHLARKCQCKE